MTTQSALILLFVVGLVGVSAYVGYQYYAEQRVATSRDVMQHEMAFTAEESIKYFNLPKGAGGGGESFVGFQPSRRSRRAYTKLSREIQGTLMWETSNGSYSYITITADSMVLEGVGDLKGNDGATPVRVRAVVKPTGIDYSTLN